MSAIMVFHGGTQVIERPKCNLGRRNLDFGQGFYVTNILEQAQSWANTTARNRKESPVINRYIMDKDTILKNYRCKIFVSYDREWLEFIVANRQGLNEAQKYDYVEGGVANDRVVDTVNLYTTGLMDLKTALGELSKHQPNNQMCILNQEIITKHFICKPSVTHVF